MSVTKKFILIISLGIVPLLIAGFLHFPTVMFVIYNTICFGLLAIDYFLSPRSNVWEIIRDDDDKLFFKTENKIRFKVRNNYNRPLLIEIKDEIPDCHFNIINSDMRKEIESNAVNTLEYTVIPNKRGSFVFKKLYIKYNGVLGLCTKYSKISLEKEYKVYPNLKDLSKYRLIMQKNKLLVIGEKTIRFQGFGSEFESLREYVDGDDYRKINWMTSARERKFIINLYEMEKNQPVLILLDIGRSMGYSVKGYKKLDYSINATLVLSDIINQKGDNSGLLIFDTDIKNYISPGKGDVHRNNFMEALYHVKDTKNTSDYELAFKELLLKQKRRSLVFIFTDFETMEEANDLTKNIGIIMRHHIPIIILIKNESLIKIARTSKDNNIKTTFEKGMAMEALVDREKIIRTLNSKGITCIESSSENFALSAVNHYLAIKNKKAI